MEPARAPWVSKEPFSPAALAPCDTPALGFPTCPIGFCFAVQHCQSIGKLSGRFCCPWQWEGLACGAPGQCLCFSEDPSNQGVSIYPGSQGELQIREVTPKDQDLGSSVFSSWCCTQFSAVLG